jgi:hypothetical protein
MSSKVKNNKLTNPSEIQQHIYSPNSKAQRNADVGLVFTPKGLVKNSATVRLGREGSNTVMIYNNTTSVVFVKFGDKDVSAPTSGLDGIPVLAGEKFVCNSGAGDFIISSSVSGVFAYVAEEGK